MFRRANSTGARTWPPSPSEPSPSAPIISDLHYTVSQLQWKSHFKVVKPNCVRSSALCSPLTLTHTRSVLDAGLLESSASFNHYTVQQTGNLVLSYLDVTINLSNQINHNTVFFPNCLMRCTGCQIFYLQKSQVELCPQHGNRCCFPVRIKREKRYPSFYLSHSFSSQCFVSPPSLPTTLTCLRCRWLSASSIGTDCSAPKTNGVMDKR